MSCRLLLRILEKKYTYKIQISTGVKYTSIAYLTGMKTKTNFWKSIILVAKATKNLVSELLLPWEMHWTFSFHFYTVYCPRIRYEFSITLKKPYMLCLIYYKCAHAFLCTRQKTKLSFFLQKKKDFVLFVIGPLLSASSWKQHFGDVHFHKLGNFVVYVTNITYKPCILFTL